MEKVSFPRNATKDPDEDGPQSEPCRGTGRQRQLGFCQAVIASRVAVQILEDVLRRDKKGLSVMYLSARACSPLFGGRWR